MIDIKRADCEVKAIIDRLAKLPRQDCKACGKPQPHQNINGKLTCWKCGSY